MSSAMEAKRRRLDSGSTDTTEPLNQQHDGYISSDGENLSSQEAGDEEEQGRSSVRQITPGQSTCVKNTYFSLVIHSPSILPR